MCYKFVFLLQFCVQEDDHEGSGIVAHFPAHAGQPLSCMSFDPRYIPFYPCKPVNFEVIIGLKNFTF